MVQQRASADELAFDDIGLASDRSAVGGRDPHRVVVSGWQVYDAKGRVVEKYEPFVSTGGAYEESTGPPGLRSVRITYDPVNRPVRLLNPDGSQRRTVFGVPDDLTDPDNYEPTPWAVTGYDENDLAPLSVDASGASLAARVRVGLHFTPTTTVQDALGRTVCTIARDATTEITRASCDLRGNLLAITDQLGRTALSRAYDLFDRPLRTDALDAGRRISVLDAAGNLCHTRDARGAQTLRTYDALNRPVEVFARDRADGPMTLRERRAYGEEDPDRAAARADGRLGRLWIHLDEAGRITAGRYDLTGAVTEEVREVVSDNTLAAVDGDWIADWSTIHPATVLDPLAEHVTTLHDALGRAVEITTPIDTDGHRARLRATYGRSGALVSVRRDTVDDVRLLARNARGQRVLRVLGNGMMTRYAYDPDTFRLVRMRTERAIAAGDTWTGSGAAVQDLTYTYDLAGNVATIEDRTPGCGVANTADGRDRLIRRFHYDGFGRLAAATGRECATIDCGTYEAPYARPPNAPNQGNAPDLTTGYREEYIYDAAGNLIDLRHVPTTGAAWRRRYGCGGAQPGQQAGAAGNRLTSVLTGSTTMPVGYDETGNLVSEGESRAYEWDHAGRLVAFRIFAGAGTSVSARYLYGADGERVKKWVRRGGDESTVYIGTVFERHQWSGMRNTLLHVMDDASQVATVRAGPAYPHEAGPPVRYEFGDHLGSAVVTTDETGEWVNREEYSPFGETTFGGFKFKRYRFTGQERDEESGLGHHGARYYAPASGRWISCDPAGAVDGVNLYTYAGNNPVRHTDRTGLSKDTAAPAGEVCEGPDIYTDAGGGVHIIIHGSGEFHPGKKSEAAPPVEDQGVLRPTGQSAVTWWDSNQRGGYVAENRAASQAAQKGIEAATKAGNAVEAWEAAKTVSKLRDVRRFATQQRLSPGGRALSELLEKSPDFVERAAEYSTRLPRVEGGTKSSTRSAYEIARRVAVAAGESRGVIKTIAKVGRFVGPIGVAVGGGLGVREVLNAPEGQRGRVAAREAGSFIGGTVGASVGMSFGVAVAAFGLGVVAGVGVVVAAPVALAVTLVFAVGSAIAIGAWFSYRGGQFGTRTYDALAR
ncbi:RHS repeat-associated core domain-containing protein [Actinoplanes sp. NEAU-A12]|uniref:RHS repeat-associated core domain-containing protein n=1 Tax=Actinoplanes sandaracinus TaxID=3045177 RepID=A0ABT6WG36_9ACTN|nr:RHS repeat-associated core domain-containing protein [Actinoplanes sandaracinus]MDI6098696.1 RHS repeat-associated core domain-containing protein [Actinoplanes sandaracinus]